MPSLYDELAEKLRKDPSLLKRSGPRQDIGILLYNARDKLRELWVAADHLVHVKDKINEALNNKAESSPTPNQRQDEEESAIEELRQALDSLNALYGDRAP